MQFHYLELYNQGKTTLEIAKEKTVVKRYPPYSKKAWSKSWNCNNRLILIYTLESKS